MGLLFNRSPKPEKLLSKALGKFKLPSFPAVVLSALRKLRNPNVPIGEVAAELERDPGVSAQLLGLSNSAARGLRHRVRSVEHAMALLGRAEVESVLLGLAVGQALPKSRTPGFDQDGFWRTAAQRATLARLLAAELQPAAGSESFTAALLQDMALPLLLTAKRREYPAVLERWKAGEGDLCQLEVEQLGFDHSDLAGGMAKMWQFPDGLVQSLGTHHADGVPYPAAALAAHLGPLPPAANSSPAEVAGGFARATAPGCSLPQSRLEQVAQQALEQAEEVAALFTGR